MMRKKGIDELPEALVAAKLRPPVETGLWRTMRPVMDGEKCVKCGFCWMYCPERAIRKTEDGGYVINYSYCKGCGICGEECPKGAIKMVEEE